jgi:hypothetical protein
LIDWTGFKFGKGMPAAGRKIVKTRQAKALETKVRNKVNARDKHRCFFPGCRSRGIAKHHLVFRSQGGAWSTGNIVSGCPTHHQWVHGGLIELIGNPDKPPLKVLPTTLGKQAGIIIPERRTR